MEQWITVQATEINSLEIECPHCHERTSIVIRPPKWEYVGEPKTALGERGLILCAWCGRAWPDTFGNAVAQLRRTLDALHEEGLPLVRFIHK